MVKRIFLDLDGVLNKFSQYVMQRFGCPISLDEKDYKPEWGWELLTGVRELTGREVSETEFWEFVTADIWADVPKSDECDEIIARARALVGRDQVFILTALPTKANIQGLANSFIGKMTWIERNLPDWPSRNIIPAKAKECCGKPGHALVDDSDRNIKRFRADQGDGVLVPRPWNSGWGKPCLKTTLDLMADLI